MEVLTRPVLLGAPMKIKDYYSFWARKFFTDANFPFKALNSRFMQRLILSSMTIGSVPLKTSRIHEIA